MDGEERLSKLIHFFFILSENSLPTYLTYFRTSVGWGMKVHSAHLESWEPESKSTKRTMHSDALAWLYLLSLKPYDVSIRVLSGLNINLGAYIIGPGKFFV